MTTLLLVLLSILVDVLPMRPCPSYLKADRCRRSCSCPCHPAPAHAGSVKYIWPIQQPVSDLGAQKTRMGELREALGWRVIGCELIECYDY